MTLPDSKNRQRSRSIARVLNDDASLINIKTFAIAARYMSFKAAARHLGLTSGAVSHRIARLEKELGFPLFNRLTRAVSLTPEGERLRDVYLNAFQKIYEEITQLLQDDFSSLTIYAAPSLALAWLIPQLSDFQQRYPSMQLHVRTGNTPIDFHGDSTVDGYVQTAHYLDQAIGELMTWLKKTGLDKKTLLVFYGDHYGISNNHNEAMAQLTGIKNYGEFEDQQYQRVPLMFYSPDLKGGVKHTYGGEIDVMPTLLNLLGISSKKMILFGHDLLSKDNPQLVAQRNGNFISSTFTKVGSSYYYTKTAKKVTSKMTKNMNGKELRISSRRIITESTLPPR